MPAEPTLIIWLKNRYLAHRHTGGEGAQVAHSSLSGLTTGNDHTQYLLATATDALLDSIITFQGQVVVHKGNVVYN